MVERGRKEGEKRRCGDKEREARRSRSGQVEHKLETERYIRPGISRKKKKRKEKKGQTLEDNLKNKRKGKKWKKNGREFLENKEEGGD